MNKKAKGNRNEYKTMRLLEAVGYECFRMAASKGAFDVIAVSQTDVLLVRVKSNADCQRNIMSDFGAFWQRQNEYA